MDSALEAQLRLYVILDPSLVSGNMIDMAEAVLAGGSTALQLRCKGVSDRGFLDLARTITKLAAEHAALFVVNDRVDIALAAGAGGVHLGVDDLPVAAARSLVPNDFVIGYSPDTDNQTEAARDAGANYLGVGPVFGTSSKHDAGPPIGLDTLARRVALAAIPVVGIGGITARNAGHIMSTGAAGVAVMGAVLSADSPMQAGRELADAIDNIGP